MIPFDSKLPAVGTTIFTVMSRLAADVGAINLSQGFPDFDCDPALVDAVAEHMRRGQNQRADAGRPAAAKRDRGKVQMVLRAPLRPRDRSDGDVRRHGGNLRCRCRVRWSGDEVVVFEPCYDSYVPAIELSGGTPVFVRCNFQTIRSTGTRSGALSPHGRG